MFENRCLLVAMSSSNTWWCSPLSFSKNSFRRFLFISLSLYFGLLCFLYRACTVLTQLHTEWPVSMLFIQNVYSQSTPNKNLIERQLASSIKKTLYIRSTTQTFHVSRYLETITLKIKRQLFFFLFNLSRRKLFNFTVAFPHVLWIKRR